MLDVSPATIYRAIESGQLDAYKIGTGKGTLRIPGQAITLYLDECGDAAYHAYVKDGASAEAGDDGELTPAQAAGLACVVCERHWADVDLPHVEVGSSPAGGPLYACTTHADAAASTVTAVS
jgi:hypothetical protein